MGMHWISDFVVSASRSNLDLLSTINAGITGFSRLLQASRNREERSIER